MAKKQKATAAETTPVNATVLTGAAQAAGADTLLADLLEELEVTGSTLQADGAGEIVEPDTDVGAVAAGELVEPADDTPPAQAADGAADISDADFSAALHAAVEADLPIVSEIVEAVVADAADGADQHAALDALLEEVGAHHAVSAADAGVAPTEVPTEALDPLDDLLEDVAADAARIDAKHELYAGQPAPDAPSAGDAPTEGKGKKARAKKSTEPKAPKVPAPSRVTHRPGDLLLVKLGEKANDYLVFDADPSINDMKRAAFIERMNDRDAIADKVRDKIIMLMGWLMSGKAPSELNEVLRRTFTVLHETGELVSGDKGNLQVNLLAKPYSMGTARSQANQMFMALPELGLCIKGKGKMTPNPDSIMLQAINAQLGLQ